MRSWRPAKQLVRQVLGAISEFDKAMTVAKLRGARERKRRGTGKCEGRKSHAERNPELVALVCQLRRKRPKGGQRSLRVGESAVLSANCDSSQKLELALLYDGKLDVWARA
jgi:hypothetical protein